MASSKVEMSDSATVSKSTKNCGLCEENVSKYCCPRCEIYYCSLDCYKSEKHAQCSEDFYRDCVNEELAGQHTDDNSRQKMIDILKRLANEDNIGEDTDNIEEINNIDSDDEDFVDLESRVKDINLDDADALWNALTVDERNEFEAMLNHGNMESIIPQWTPWWEFRKEKKKVQDMSSTDDSELAHLKSCPEHLKVVKFSELTNTTPSPTIRFNIANCIASYAFVMRYFNGEVDPLEGAVYIIHICDNLSSNANYNDPEIAVESVAQKCLQSDIIETDKESLEVMKHDVYLIFNGPSKDHSSHYYKSSLSDLHRIFRDAKKKLRSGPVENKKVTEGFSKKYPEHGNEHLPKLEASKLKMYMKKIEYYLSFLESCNS